MVHSRLSSLDQAIAQLGNAIEEELRTVAVPSQRGLAGRLGERWNAAALSLVQEFPSLRTSQRLGSAVADLTSRASDFHRMMSGQTAFMVDPTPTNTYAAHAIQKRLITGVAYDQYAAVEAPEGEWVRLEGFEGFAQARNAHEVGGDVYAVAAETPTHTRVLFADAMGHGLRAAIVAARLLGMFELGTAMGIGLVSLARHLDERMAALGIEKGGLATAFLGDFQRGTNVLRYCSAGQAPLLHFDATDGTCRWLDATCPPLGTLTVSDSSDTEEIVFRDRDGFLLASDGIFECRAPDGRMFGRGEVCKLVQRHWSAPPAHCVRATAMDMLACCCHFAGRQEPEDDQTVLCLQRTKANLE
jgi:hypothetical protein